MTTIASIELAFYCEKCCADNQTGHFCKVSMFDIINDGVAICPECGDDMSLDDTPSLADTKVCRIHNDWIEMSSPIPFIYSIALSTLGLVALVCSVYGAALLIAKLF